jgi:hypothetical protein
MKDAAPFKKSIQDRLKELKARAESAESALELELIHLEVLGLHGEVILERLSQLCED